MIGKSRNIKKSIFTLLSKTKGPLSVSEILDIIPANKTSIYRALYAMMKEGTVSELEFSDRIKRYEAATLGHHHHLVCTYCKKIEEVEIEDNFRGQEKELEKKTGFKSIRHDLEFYGTCHTCSKI